MLINGIEFDFSTLNADDVQRMKAALEKQKTRAETEGRKYTPDGDGYEDWLCFQCRIFEDYLDEVLGEGASAKLGLNGRNFKACMDVSKAFTAAMAAEKQDLVEQLHPDAASAQPAASTAVPIPAPMNREQRRAVAKASPVKLQVHPDAEKHEAGKADRREKLQKALAALSELVELDND